ncbi:uncharacterized protein J7T54_002874 [Emericellopsis cladophorae]|uniref:Methyltransferase type 11 domain-containing protein n=1 Tax=Emericellopsis cladophorae TaxID=2686198 RepID=A0A9Q0B9A1_9HYPO|nr:uncharacterized protein J7T54_002874 [Emericellopsis cladophorae]KAI6777772.1 hypothetical protein J7T54_002874 [Emericellopsis cladophorae]
MSLEADTRVWDKTARSYAKSKVSDQAGYQRTLDRTRSLLKPTDRALELGCGTGSTALLLARHVQSYLATDISPEMTKICEEKKQHEDSNAVGLHALSFRAASAESLAAENPCFDVILGFNYLHLVRDLPTTLQSVYTMLKDGGLFITKTGCVGDMNVLLPWVVLPIMQMVGKAPTRNGKTRSAALAVLACGRLTPVLLPQLNGLQHPVCERLTNFPVQARRVIDRLLDVHMPELASEGIAIAIAKTRICWYIDMFDNHFVVDRVPRPQGLMVATGGSGHPFKYLPNIGDWVIDVMEGVGLSRPAVRAWRSRGSNGENPPVTTLMMGARGDRVLSNFALVRRVSKDAKCATLAESRLPELVVPAEPGILLRFYV